MLFVFQRIEKVPLLPAVPLETSVFKNMPLYLHKSKAAQKSVLTCLAVKSVFAQGKTRSKSSSACSGSSRDAIVFADDQRR